MFQELKANDTVELPFYMLCYTCQHGIHVFAEPFAERYESCVGVHVVYREVDAFYLDGWVATVNFCVVSLV